MAYDVGFRPHHGRNHSAIVLPKADIRASAVYGGFALEPEIPYLHMKIRFDPQSIITLLSQGYLAGLTVTIFNGRLFVLAKDAIQLVTVTVLLF